MKTLFTESYLECFLDEENKVLMHIWTNKPTSDQFRNGLTKIYDEYNKHKAQFQPLLHWLGDTRKMGVLSIEDQGWLDRVWNEMLFVKAGVRTHAVIIGNDIFAKYAMEKFKTNMQTRYASLNLNMETFASKDEAYKWFSYMEKELSAKSA